MKKAITFALTVLFMLSIAGCAVQTSSPASVPSAPPPVESSTPSDTPSTPTPSPTPAFSYPLTTYSNTVKVNDGYEIKVTYNIGKWIKESDKEMLDAAWKGVGGIGDFPMSRGQMSFLDVNGTNESYDLLTKQDYVFCFGTLTCQNATSGFNISNGANVKVHTGLNISNIPSSANFSQYNPMPLAIVVNQKVYVSLNSAGMGTFDDFLVGYNGRNLTTMNSNTLGPLPFVFAIGCTPTPDKPDKLTDFVSELVFSMVFTVAGSDYETINPPVSFKIDKSW